MKTIRFVWDTPTFSALVSFLTFIVFIPFSRLDFDVHHDGLLMSAAIAQSQGLSVHEGYYAQYGPLLPWIQSVSLLFTDHAALSIRILNTFLIALSIFAILEIGRLKPRGFFVSRSSAIVTSVVWIICADVFGWAAMLPWSSVLSLTMSLLGLLALNRTILYHEAGQSKRSQTWLIMAGSIFAMMPFARINMGLSALLVVTSLALVLLLTSHNYRKLARNFLLYESLTLLVLLGYLFKLGATSEWWRQSIREPWDSQEKMKQTYEPMDALMRTVETFIPIYVFLIFSLVLFAYVKYNSKIHKISLAMIGNFAVGLSLTFLFLIQDRSALVVSGALRGGNSYFAKNQIVNNFVAFLSWTSLFLAVIGAVVLLIAYLLNRIDPAYLLWWLLVGGLAVSGLTQVWPVPDSRHYWWGLPIGLLLISSTWEVFTGGEQRTYLKLLHPLIFPALGALTIVIPSAVSYLDVPRQVAPNKSPIRGMLLGQDYWGRDTFKLIDDDFALMSKFINTNDRVLYVTLDGHYASLLGTFNSVDAKYVSWPSVGNLENRIRDSKFIVLDRSQEFLVRPLLENQDLVFRGNNDWLVIYENLSNRS